MNDRPRISSLRGRADGPILGVTFSARWANFGNCFLIEKLGPWAATLVIASLGRILSGMCSWSSK
jgi:hypothetical protein